MIQTSIIRKKYYHINRIDETEYTEKVWKKKAILDKYDALRKEGCAEETIFTVLEVPRSTFYRWKRSYNLYSLSGLEDQSRRPIGKKKKSWEHNGLEQKIYHLRIKYKVWGKAKLAVIYNQTHENKITESMVGRILKKLVLKKKIEPVSLLIGKRGVKRRVFNGHAQRLPKDMKPLVTGDLIQIDHMTVEVPKIGVVKHFNAICPLTKIAVQRIYRDATSGNAADFLNHVIKQLPFPIRSIQVDGGSEFKKDFESTCKQHSIPLFVLPPRSPEKNGTVERGNGTFKYEFYSLYASHPTLYMLQKKLQQFVDFYNNTRPHQSLKYLTPIRFYESIKNHGGSVSYVAN
jgi:hypothetical protein